MGTKHWLNIRSLAACTVSFFKCVLFAVIVLLTLKADTYAAPYKITDKNGAVVYNVTIEEDATLYKVARGCLEILYFISGITLALTVYLSVRSIRLTKSLATEEEARQKRKFALDLCDKYINDLHLQFKDLKEFEDKADKQFINRCITLVNKLEIFSLSFVDGHADIVIARSLIGEVFCDNAEELLHWCPPQQCACCPDDIYLTRLIKMLK